MYSLGSNWRHNRLIIYAKKKKKNKKKQINDNCNNTLLLNYFLYIFALIFSQ